MTDNMPLPGTPEYSEDFDDFHLQFGRALSAWAQLEHHLGLLFCRLTGLSAGPAGMGSALFYSGRSFQSRADLLSAAIGSVNAPEHQRALHRALLKKARQYASVRNTIAHGIPIALMGSGPFQGLRIKQGDALFLDDDGINQNQLSGAMLNFSRLARIAIKILISGSSPEQCQECLQLIQALPTDAFSLGDPTL